MSQTQDAKAKAEAEAKAAQGAEKKAQQEAADKQTQDAKAKAATQGREAATLGGLHPNVPSFDFDFKAKKPNLRDQEEVVVEVEKKGVKIFVTNMGRKIFGCTIADYEEKFTPLTNRQLWETHFPQAAK